MGASLEKIKILCLHGFLGLPTDWELIQSYFMVSPLARQFEWHSVDYMKTPGLDPKNSFENWARNFNQKVKSQVPSGPRVLVGYSLGGRLALQAMKQDPDLYDKAIFISTNPGLRREKEKQERFLNDELWAKKFLENNWEDLMKEWNSQAVFKESLSEPPRFEAHYLRLQLAQALTEWSLAGQEDFRDLIARQSQKVLWVSGEKDIKFASITMELKKQSPQIQTEIFAKASHRVLFDQPSELAQKMIAFIDEDFGAL